MKKRGSMPSAPIMRYIQQSYPDLSADYILFAEGPMLRDGRALAPIEAAEPKPDYTTAAGTVEEAGAVVRLARSETENEQLRQRLEDAKAEIAWLRGKSRPSADAAGPKGPGPTPTRVLGFRLSVSERLRGKGQREPLS